MCKRALMVFLLGCGGVVCAAEAQDSAGLSRGHSSAVEIVSSALGLERFKEYSANQNAMGVGFARVFGLEASYYNLGESKYARHIATGEGTVNDNIGGRVNLKLALDYTNHIGDHARIFSRTGVYVWDLDMNYNRGSHEFNAGQAGTSGVVGVGAAYGFDGTVVSFEIEQLNSAPDFVDRGRGQVLFNLSSRF